MLLFITRRVTLILITLWVVSIATFAITEILPGDVASSILGQGATEQNKAALRKELGLDRPAYERYGDWISGVVQGDLGQSLRNRRPIAEVIGDRLGNSVILAVFAFIVAVPSAVLAGIWAGVKRDSPGDRILTTLGMLLIAIPEFVTGVLLIVLLSSTLHLLPSSSIILPGTSPLSRPEILVMPALTLTGVLFAYIMRMTRANVIEVMQSHYVRTAILKGLTMRRVIQRHVVPNALLPTISVIAANIGWLLGGLIIVEVVFSYAGLGRLVLDAVSTRDVPLLQAVTLIIAAAYTLSNLAADLSYGLLNPRVRLA